MSKAFNSILIILCILFIYSAKLSGDIQSGHTLKESSIGREEKSTSVSELQFIEEKGEKSFLADILLLKQKSREQLSSIKDLSNRVETLSRDNDIEGANFGIFIENDIQNIETGEK